MIKTYANPFALQSKYTQCAGECGATQEDIVTGDVLDYMYIEIPRSHPFSMDGHYPVVVGRMPDKREAYVFKLYNPDGLGYFGFGPTPEESSFLKGETDGILSYTRPSPSDILYLAVLRYEPETYLKRGCEANNMRSENIRMDTTGLFPWKFHRYLPASTRHSVPSQAQVDCLSEPFNNRYC